MNAEERSVALLEAKLVAAEIMVDAAMKLADAIREAASEFRHAHVEIMRSIAKERESRTQENKS